MDSVSMSSRSAYRAGPTRERSARTRARIMAAVRELLAEGRFHETSVEEVAERAGIARATLYQHFGSRLALIESLCDEFEANPELVAIREAINLPDVADALSETIAHSRRFWSAEDVVLSQLYGVVAVDPAARDLVDRQRSERREEMLRLVTRLRRSGRLRGRLTDGRALGLLMTLTSYETYRELRLAGLSEREVDRTLKRAARRLLLAKTPA
jgi:AcrR family transcriptional regulator